MKRYNSIKFSMIREIIVVKRRLLIMKVDAGLFVCIIGFICCCAYLYQDKIAKFIGWNYKFDD